MNVFKSLALALAVTAVAAVPAFADEPGGIVGSVVDVNTGKPLASVPITITRVEKQPRTWNATTDKKGTFVNVTLEPGRYLVVATLPGQTIGCAIDDVFGGQTVKLRIGIGGTAASCSGPRVHPALVDPSAAADVYRIGP